MSDSNIERSDFGPFEDLEEQQYKRLYFAYDVPLMDLRKGHYRIFLFGGILLLALVIVLSTTVQIPNYLQVPIKMENTERDFVMLFNHSVKVGTFAVEAGEKVGVGQVICTISSPEIQSLIAEIRAAETAIIMLKGADSVFMASQLTNLSKQNQVVQAQLNNLQAERVAATALFDAKAQALQNEVTYFADLEDRNKQLLEKEAISEMDYLAIENKFLDKKAALNTLEKAFAQQLQQFNIEQAQIQEQLVGINNDQSELQNAFLSDRSKREESIKLAKQKLDLFYGDYSIVNNKLVLKAPYSGTMSYCYSSNELLQAGEILYRLETNQGTYEAVGFVGANKIGYITDGLITKIQLETFPLYEWGTLSGKVRKISTSPNETGDFSLYVKLTDENPEISPRLQIGQSGIASVLIEKKTLAGYLVRKFKKNTHSILE